MSVASHQERRTSFPSAHSGYTLYLYKANRSAPLMYLYVYGTGAPDLPVYRWFRVDRLALAAIPMLQRDAVAVLSFLVGDATT